MARHVIAQSGAPAAAPDFIGQHYVNTSNGDHYLASGTASVSDWGDPVGSGGVGQQMTPHDYGTVSAVTLDVTNGFVQTFDYSSSFGPAVNDPPATGDYWRFRLIVNNTSGSNQGLLWPSKVKPSGESQFAINNPAAGISIFDFHWHGTEWFVEAVVTPVSA